MGADFPQFAVQSVEKYPAAFQRELSKTEKQTIAHFCYYFDDKACFALLGDYTIVALSAENACDLELLRQEALPHMANLIIPLHYAFHSLLSNRASPGLFQYYLYNYSLSLYLVIPMPVQ